MKLTNEGIELTTKQLEKLETMLFNLAKRFEKLTFNSYDKIEVFKGNYMNPNRVFAKFTHWTAKEGIAITFLFENDGDISKRNDWKYVSHSQFPQSNFPFNQMHSWDRIEILKKD